MLKPNGAAYNRLVADDFLQNNQFGGSLNKARYSDTVVGGHLKFDSYTTSDVSFRVYGDAGVVTGIESTKGNLDGADRSGRRRFTRIYVKKQGRWQIVNNQLTNIQ
jgi:hypothetical protein